VEPIDVIQTGQQVFGHFNKETFLVTREYRLDGLKIHLAVDMVPDCRGWTQCRRVAAIPSWFCGQQLYRGRFRQALDSGFNDLTTEVTAERAIYWPLTSTTHSETFLNLVLRDPA
jgi:hypothetical protein